MFKLLVYLSKSFLLTWLGCVFGFLLLIGLLDSLANGGDIVGGQGGFSSTFRYMGLRAPVIFDRIFVFTLIVSVLLIYVKLIRNHELVALLGFGISVPKQVALLTPAVVGAALASITVINTAMPPAVRALQAWGIGEYKARNVSPEDPLWIEDEGRIIRAESRPGYLTLGDIQFFLRDEAGAVERITWAKRAEFKGENWELTGVRVLETEGLDGGTRQAVMQSGPSTWVTRQTPESIARLAAEPRDLGLADQNNFSRKGNSGSKPAFAYEFWWLHRLTRPIAAFILLLCAAPIMQRLGREATGEKALVVGLTLGFVFLIIDGAMATFAASGGVVPWIAIVSPLAVFGLGGAWLLLRTESLA